MSTKNSLAIQRCELSRKELDEFPFFYPILSKYHVILPTSSHTILHAPPGYIGLYTHCFSLANLRLPLNDFFCKAYDCEPSVELFCGFFNLCKAGSWLTFQKRSEKHIPSLLDKVITRIEGWHQRFFFIQDTIVPSKFPQLLLKENMIGIKSFKDKLPSGIEKNPQFQRLGRIPFSACASMDPILFLDWLQSLWNMVNSYLHLCGGGYRSLSVLMKIRNRACERALRLILSVATRIRERKCKTRGGSSRPLIKRKLASGSSTSRTVHAKVSAMKDDTHVLSISDDEGLEDCLELKDATDCHLKIFAITPPAWKGFLDNQLDVDLLDLHDRCYARQAVVDNAVNRRSRELLKVIEKMRGEADAMRASELAPEEECEGIRARLMLESQKWSGYQMSLSDLESKVASLESEKANLEATKALLRQEIEEVKHDRRYVVSKVVPYACMELLHIDKLGRLVGKLVSLAITFEVLLSKKPPTLQKPVPSRTHMPVPSSQLATPSSAPSSKPMSPSTDIVKLTPSPNE
ncbi:hypothetical protein Tco_1533105 [Tanacetum coccineum]